MLNPLPSQRLRDYTSIPVEILVVALSVAPVLILIYFYAVLPERIPVFLNLRGEVEVWAAKSVVSVFRVPAMAIDLQAICLLMKYGSLRSRQTLPAGNVEEYLQYQRRAYALNAGLWDWLRCFNAVKMCAESLDILFMGDGRSHFLRTPARTVTWIAVILAIVGALFYVYRLLVVRREMKKAMGNVSIGRRVDRAHLYGRIFYYNPDDPAVFVEKYAVNFANKWVYVLVACVAAYPLLVFSPL
ncbi:MAG: hypothetical protein QOJ02_2167 [Acidobacteriota bacterium]|jgi:uncharacterized membrane protein|nr:hypothetical protein [Acidobacteriota bacterium]